LSRCEAKWDGVHNLQPLGVQAVTTPLPCGVNPETEKA